MELEKCTHITSLVIHVNGGGNVIHRPLSNSYDDTIFLIDDITRRLIDLSNSFRFQSFIRKQIIHN